MGIGLAYVQTRLDDIQPIRYQRLANFVIEQSVRHVAIGLVDPSSQRGRIICGVSNQAVMVQHFIMRLPANVRLSAHPYDGFAHPEWPFRYENLTGIRAVARYVRHMNQLLSDMGSPVLFSGLVFGESMGGKPYKNNAATVQQFRSAMHHEGLDNFILGASPGGPNFGLDESYYQCYDWTPYGSGNPNPWITYRNHPQQFFNAIIQMNQGWNGQNNIAPWSQTNNYYNANLALWRWEIPQEGTQKKHFMWALNVPEGDHKRLSAWSREGIKQFFRYVGGQMFQGTTGFQTAVYFDQGLQYFKSE